MNFFCFTQFYYNINIKLIILVKKYKIDVYYSGIVVNGGEYMEEKKEEVNTIEPNNKKGNNKALIIVVSIVGGVCLLLLAIFLIYHLCIEKDYDKNYTNDNDNYKYEVLNDITYNKLSQKEVDSYNITEFKSYDQDALNGQIGTKDQIANIMEIKDVGGLSAKTNNDDNYYNYELKIEDNKLKVSESITGYSTVIERVKNPKSIYKDKSNYFLITTNDNYYYIGQFGIQNADSDDSNKKKLKKAKDAINIFENELSRFGGKYPVDVVVIKHGSEVLFDNTMALKFTGYTDSDYYIMGDIKRYDGYGLTNKDYKISEDAKVHIDSDKHFTIDYKGKVFKLNDQNKVFVTAFDTDNYIVIISTECGESHLCSSCGNISLINKKTGKLIDTTVSSDDYGLFVDSADVNDDADDYDYKQPFKTAFRFMFKKNGDKYQIALNISGSHNYYVVFDNVSHNETVDFIIHE